MFPDSPDDPYNLYTPPSEETQPSTQEETRTAATPSVGEESVLPVVEGQPALPTVPSPVTGATELPPEAQGETNGGPLGCCLGTVVGLFLTVLLVLCLSLLLSNGGVLSFATVPVIALGTIAGGYGGWKIGKRIYKEYEPPVVKRQVRTTTKKRKKKRTVQRTV
jgi:hypothetical protein